jgi:hypothetical protein
MFLEVRYVLYGMVYSADQSVKEVADPHRRYLCCTFLRNVVYVRAHVFF